MKYYYCQSKFEHAVIEAHNSADAKEKYIGIINAQLEDYAKLTVKDVDSCVVNVYFSESHEDREIANLRVKMGTQVAMRMVDSMSSIIVDCAMLVGAMRELCYEIEKCGASEQLTNTVVLASEITNELKYITGGVAVEHRVHPTSEILRRLREVSTTKPDTDLKPGSSPLTCG